MNKKKKAPEKIIYFNSDVEDGWDVDWGNFLMDRRWSDDFEM